MKSKRVIAAIVLGLGLALTLLWLGGAIPARADPGTRYVRTAGNGYGGAIYGSARVAMTMTNNNTEILVH